MTKELAQAEESKLRLPKFLRLSWNQQLSLWPYIFLIIPMAYFLFVRFVPTLSTINMSLRDWSLLMPEKEWVGFANYVRMFEDPKLIKAATNTATIVLIMVPLQIIVALTISVLLVRIPKGRGIYRLIYFIPFMTIAPVVGKVWKYILAVQRGPINLVLQELGLEQQPFLTSPDQALYLLIGVIVWSGIGFSTVILVAGIIQIPATYYEAARIDGANGWQLFRHITLPLINPALVFVTIITTLRALREFTIPYVITPGSAIGGPLNSLLTLMIQVYVTGFRKMKMGYASAITVCMLVIMMTISLVQLRIMRRRIEY
ncbi:MAG: ABC transporter permease subunit [Anaerolineales bacterium]|nr:ABC transporter permease subunit [Anaerolineales bacterium]